MSEETSGRRSFLSYLSRGLLAAATLLLAWGVARFTLFEAGRTERKEFALSVLNDLKPGIPVHVPEAGAWLWKSRLEAKPVAYDDRCTHLGCRAKWDEKKRVLRCPCHGSEFDLDGSVKRGPADRPLQRLYLGRTKGDKVRLLEDPPKPASRS